jgi:hypothetical protein
MYQQIITLTTHHHPSHQLKHIVLLVAVDVGNLFITVSV